MAVLTRAVPPPTSTPVCPLSSQLESFVLPRFTLGEMMTRIQVLEEDYIGKTWGVEWGGVVIILCAFCKTSAGLGVIDSFPPSPRESEW